MSADAAAAAPALTPAQQEEEILRQRLNAKEASLRSLTKHYLAFANAVETASVEECQGKYQELLREIAAYEFAVSKARALMETNTRQVLSVAPPRLGRHAVDAAAAVVVVVHASPAPSCACGRLPTTRRCTRASRP